jgi:molecular chaperone GrpE
MRALLFLLGMVVVQGWLTSRAPVRRWTRAAMCTAEEGVEGTVADKLVVSEDDIKSQELSRLMFKIDEAKAALASTKADIAAEKEQLKQLDDEYGSEIARVKKEFSRIKERSVEEAVQISNKAKADALKEVLPISDNYLRAKTIYLPAVTDNEQLIADTYDKVFADMETVTAGFGVVKVPCLGQPYDFNFMEAIMAAPSTEYAKDIVCTEYQVGYKMGEQCIRPAMVVVSLGPGPATSEAE